MEWSQRYGAGHKDLSKPDDQLNNLEAKFTWRHYNIALNDEEMVGSGNMEQQGMDGEMFAVV